MILRRERLGPRERGRTSPLREGLRRGSLGSTCSAGWNVAKLNSLAVHGLFASGKLERGGKGMSGMGLSRQTDSKSAGKQCWEEFRRKGGEFSAARLARRKRCFGGAERGGMGWRGEHRRKLVRFVLCRANHAARQGRGSWWRGASRERCEKVDGEARTPRPEGAARSRWNVHGLFAAARWMRSTCLCGSNA